MAPRQPVNLLPTHPDHPERAATVHELTQLAFAPYAALDRPSGALAETVDDVAADLAAGGALLAYDDRWEHALGALRWRLEDDHLWVKRVAVHPDHQGTGVGTFLMDACRGVCHAVDRREIRLGIRHALEANRRWYARRGFVPRADHGDWGEYAVAVEPLPFTDPVTLWKYEYPDHLQSTFPVDVVEELDDGWWVRSPAFTPHQRDGRLLAVVPAPLEGWLPKDRWWTAWFTRGHQHMKVDICTPAVRRPDGDFEFRDLCLDVVLRGDDPPLVVDEDEFAAADYPADVAAAARRAADEVVGLLAVTRSSSN